MLNRMLSKSIKKILPYRHIHRAIDETLKIPEKCWPFQFQKTQGFRVAKSATLICISTVLKLLT